MRAITHRAYGAPPDVLKLENVPKPPLEPGKVLVRIRAAAVHAGDWHLIRGTPFFIRLMFGTMSKPTVLVPGCELAGVVEQVASDVTDLAVGDDVFGDVSESGFGAFAEYICLSPSALAKIPSGVSFQQAAASCTSALAALQAVRDVGQVHTGSSVLVNGASGGVGTFAVQIAKSFGAQVTAVCRADKVAVLKAIGVQNVLDYSETDVTKMDDKYDVIIDAAAFRSPLDYVKILNKKGKYITVGGSTSRFMQVMISGAWMSFTRGVEMKALESKPKVDDLVTIGEMLRDGKVVPVIDRTFALESVADAITYVEDRKVTGKVGIEM